MNQWWAGLNQRERRIVVLGSIAVLLTLLYLLVVEPVITHMRDLDASVREQTELLLWMQSSEQQIAKLRASSGSANRSISSGGSLLA